MNQISTIAGTIFYEIQGDEAIITAYEGREREVVLPEQIENYPVTKIAKKAFMGNRYLKGIVFPKSLHTIEDWAFAHCEKFQIISLYYKEYKLGRGVFLECNKLAKANLLDGDSVITNQITEQQLESLLGILILTVTSLDAYYLFSPTQILSAGWQELVDARVTSILNSDDMDGYSLVVSCGEEDYSSTNMEAFLSEKCKRKVRLLLQRLLFDFGLKKEQRDVFITYLKEHMPPSEGAETWEIVLNEHIDEKEYFELLCDIGCVTQDNIEQLIMELGTKNPEMKAYLIRYKEENFETKDFFAAFEL